MAGCGTEAADLLAAWDIPAAVAICRRTNGHFNRIYEVTAAGGSRYILRIYESDSDLGRLRREQMLIEALRGGAGLPFALPVYVPSMDGSLFVPTAEGLHYAVLMPLIEGGHPDMSDCGQMYESGKALGILNREMLRLPAASILRGEPVYSSFRTIHPAVKLLEADLEKAAGCAELASRTEASTCMELTARIQEIAAAADEICASGSYNRLPRQWIHGDYTNGNHLLHGGRISGVLDFEFCCFDVRAMEAAVAIGGGPTAMWEHDPALESAVAFIRGYTSEHALTCAELDMLPSLIMLRRTAMLVYFLGRYMDGYETPRSLRSIMKWVIAADDWLHHNGDVLTERLKAAIGQEREACGG